MTENDSLISYLRNCFWFVVLGIRLLLAGKGKQWSKLMSINRSRWWTDPNAVKKAGAVLSK